MFAWDFSNRCKVWHVQTHRIAMDRRFAPTTVKVSTPEQPIPLALHVGPRRCKQMTKKTVHMSKELQLFRPVKVWRMIPYDEHGQNEARLAIFIVD